MRREHMSQRYEIAPIEMQDLKQVMGLVKNEKWRGYSVDDLALVMAISPDICFKLVCDGQLVGAIFALAVPKVVYVSFFLIHRDHRGFQLGMALGQRCLSGADKVSDAIMLYGNRRAVSAYMRIGFRPQHWVTRFRITSQDTGAIASPGVSNVDVVSVDQVLELDKACYRTDRSKLLSSLLLYEESRYYGYRPENAGSIEGYAFVRKCLSDYIVGPLVATSAEVASELLLRILADTPSRTAWLDVNNETLPLTCSARIAFERTDVSVRKMYRGDEQALEDDNLLYAVGGHHFS
jgi:GNAT superfamily N-acetyltransferase